MSQQAQSLVIGASRGIGLGLVRGLLAQGRAVIATARRPDAAPELQALRVAASGQLDIRPFDLNDLTSSNNLVAALASVRLDRLILNAGVYGPGEQELAVIDAAAIGSIMMTNAVAPVRLAQRLLPQVIDGGTIAFLTSRMGSIADNSSGNDHLYRSSKVALNMLTRSFAITDVGRRSVTVLSLHPGWVRTDMGGPNASISVEASVGGLLKVLDEERAPGHRFIDYRGTVLPW